MPRRHHDTSEDRNLLGVNSYFFPFVRSSRSVASSEKNAARISLQSIRTTTQEISKPVATGWVPYTFRNYYMSSLSLMTFALCIVTFLLWWRSSTNYGLGPDNGILCYALRLAVYPNHDRRDICADDSCAV